jgi:hypothetical protein
MSIDAALRRAKTEYERDPATDADDSFRPFDIATRAIQLMFPGMGEGCVLRWEDVDLQAGTLRVVHAVEWRK